MERYDSYKDSGVKWLGQIPSHWEVKHLRNFLTLFSEKGYGDCQLLSVTREKGVILRDKDNKEENHNFVPDDLSGYKHLNAGDFVINKMKSWQGSYGVSEYEGIVSPAYFTCKLHGVKPSFFSRAIRSKAYIGFFMQYSKGIRVDQWDLDPNSMKDIPFILPPIAEQDAIVTYLDTATAKIDTAILQQQKMIDLLNERKQIIINNAVTKGLNPNVKMKDSGVYFLPKLPNQWKVRKAKFLFKEENRPVRNEDEIVTCFRDGQVTLRKNRRIDGFTNSLKEIGYQGVRVGDLVIHNMDAFAGSIGVSDSDGKSTPVYSCCTPLSPDVNQYYYCYLLRYLARNGFILSLAKGIRERSTDFRFNDFKELYLPLPSRAEQDAIVTYLDTATAKIDTAILQQQKMIDLLKERKQIIINEVVSGKVKVL